MLFAGLLLGLGWYQWAKQDLAAETRATANRQIAELASLRSANRELAATVSRALQSVAAETQPAVVPPEPWAASPVDRTARTRALLALVNSGELGRLTYPSPSQYKVATKVEKLAEVLGLTPAEAQPLHGAVNRVVSELLAGAEVVAAGDTVRFALTDSPGARARFGEMRETFRQVLGEDGHALYEALGFNDALENSLNNLGLVGYSMTVTKVLGTDGKPVSYQFLRQGTAPAAVIAGGIAVSRPARNLTPVTDAEAAEAEAQRRTEMAAREESREGAAPVGARVPDRATLASRLGPLDALLPPDF